MADDKPKGSLSKEQEEKAINWVKDKWSINKLCCEVCNNRSWRVLGDIVVPMIFDKGGIALGGNMTPQFMAMCNNCGNTKYFNALVSGVLDEKKTEEQNG